MAAETCSPGAPRCTPSSALAPGWVVAAEPREGGRKGSGREGMFSAELRKGGAVPAE